MKRNYIEFDTSESLSSSLRSANRFVDLFRRSLHITPIHHLALILRLHFVVGRWEWLCHLLHSSSVQFVCKAEIHRSVPYHSQLHPTHHTKWCLHYSILLIAISYVAVLFHTIKVNAFLLMDTETPQISLPTSNCSPIVVSSYMSEYKIIIHEHFPHIRKEILSVD